MPSALEGLLAAGTVVVADTGDPEAVAEHRPRDATTNPSLILKAQRAAGRGGATLAAAVAEAREAGEAGAEAVVDRLLVLYGSQILDLVPGRVSTEVDAKLSFDAGATVAKARKLIRLYEARGVSRARVLIKLAATWEGVQACRILEAEGIHCNMTLVFSLTQAAACAEAGATLISPFVGRILDWFRQSTGRDFAPAEDPGILSVKACYAYYQRHGYDVEVMGASFRSVGEILELAGCPLLTISPALLTELREMEVDEVPVKLSPEAGKAEGAEKLEGTEALFRYRLAMDAMASEKLNEGIRKFVADAEALERIAVEAIAA